MKSFFNTREVAWCSRSHYPRLANVVVNFKGPRYTTDEAYKIMLNFSKQIWPQFPYETEMEKMFKSCQIHQRTMHLPIGQISSTVDNKEYDFSDVRKTFEKTFEKSLQNITFKKSLQNLLRDQRTFKKSLQNLLQERRTFEKVDSKLHIFHSTLSSIPSYDTGVQNYLCKISSEHSEKVCKPDVARISLSPMGCVGGVSALSLAANICHSNIYPSISINTIEVFASKYWKFGLGGNYSNLLINESKATQSTIKHNDINDRETLNLRRGLGRLPPLLRQFWLSASLFGDGAASMLLLSHKHPAYKYIPQNFPYIIGSTSFTVPNTENIVQVYQNSLGLVAKVDKQLIDVVKLHVPGVIELLLKKYKVKLGDINRWIIHPGGPKILETLSNIYSASSKCNLDHSWQSLRDNGNCASVSIVDVLHRTIHCKKDPPKFGDKGIMLSIGPGINIQAILLSW